MLAYNAFRTVNLNTCFKLGVSCVFQGILKQQDFDRKQAEKSLVQLKKVSESEKAKMVALSKRNIFGKDGFTQYDKYFRRWSTCTTVPTTMNENDALRYPCLR